MPPPSGGGTSPPLEAGRRQMTSYSPMARAASLLLPLRRPPQRTRLLDTEDRPRLVCDRCQHIHYLDPKVVVGVIVERGGRVLLLRRAIGPRYGTWTFPGGYMEVDETAENGRPARGGGGGGPAGEARPAAGRLLAAGARRPRHPGGGLSRRPPDGPPTHRARGAGGPLVPPRRHPLGATSRSRPPTGPCATGSAAVRPRRTHGARLPCGPPRPPRRGA